MFFLILNPMRPLSLSHMIPFSLHKKSGGANLFLDTTLEVHENEVVEFYVNLIILEDNIATSSINGVELVFDNVHLRCSDKVVDPKHGPHQLAFGNLITIVFKAFEVPLREDRVSNKKDMITRLTLVDCRLLDNNDHVPIVALRATGLVSIFLNDLRAAKDQNASLLTEIESLHTNSTESQGKVARLKDQLLQQ
ncbi:hypothetical protein KY285_000569 [Solanum tuberosum]|nr:hypothetical protein KY285_000569 [Solanum tuberosum]